MDVRVKEERFGDVKILVQVNRNKAGRKEVVWQRRRGLGLGQVKSRGLWQGCR